MLGRRNAFLVYKNKKFKKWKYWHFSKGVNSWFWSKNGHFSNFFFFGNIGQENVFNDILKRKNVYEAYKNKKFKKSKNWHFGKGVNQLLWPKNGHFSKFFFLGNIDQENVFYAILERKNAFLGCKNKKCKKSKIDILPKGLTHDFGPKMAIFQVFFFRQYRPWKSLLRYYRA